MGSYRSTSISLSANCIGNKRVPYASQYLIDLGIYDNRIKYFSGCLYLSGFVRISTEYPGSGDHTKAKPAKRPFFYLSDRTGKKPSVLYQCIICTIIQYG